MHYPVDRIDQTAHYYALTFTADLQGRASIGAFTEWVGWADVKRRIELRVPSLVIPDRMAKIWTTLKEPFCVVNSIDDFIRWYRTGGHALVAKELAESLFSRRFKPLPCIQVGEMGFVGLSLLPKTIFHRAPTAKMRLAVLKRDNYRCRICGRRATDYTDIELNVHHIRPFGRGGVTHESNLMTLCNACHRGLDPHYEWSLFSLLESDDPSDLVARTRNVYLVGVARYRESMQKR